MNKTRLYSQHFQLVLIMLCLLKKKEKKIWCMNHNKISQQKCYLKKNMVLKSYFLKILQRKEQLQNTTTTIKQTWWFDWNKEDTYWTKVTMVQKERWKLWVHTPLFRPGGVPLSSEDEEDLGNSSVYAKK